jgi:hypothetical protein
VSIEFAIKFEQVERQKGSVVSFLPSLALMMIPLPVYSHFQAFAVSDPPIDAGLPRCALRGSLDPITGIFYRAPEHHARMRTLQACDKCRVRKAKVPSFHQCLARVHFIYNQWALTV